MKDKLSGIIILIIFVAFATYISLTDNSSKVINVITPTKIQIDTNKNGIIDEGETFCIPEITTFTANIRYNSAELAKKSGLTFAQSLEIGYMADKFAKNLLDGVSVKLETTDHKTPDCQYADIIIENKKYSNLLKESGFAFINNSPVSDTKFKTLLKEAEKLNLVILNHHSGKYHTLECQYGQVAHDAIIIPLIDIKKEYKPCKFCHVDKHNKNSTAIDIAAPPNIITDGNLKLILTDFTTILKPDRNCNHAACREFVSQINSATDTIDVASYGWANIPAINNAFTKAQKRGVIIRVVYDTNTKNTNYYSETDKFLSAFELKRSDKIDNEPKLTNMLMHNKFAIFDKQKVYTGSMNFSTTGFSGFNHNNILIINSKQIAEIYTKEFEQMYNGKFHTLKNKSENNINVNIGNTNLSVYFSPQDKGMTNELSEIINKSKKYIYIPTFLFTHKKLEQELINAHNRGIDIKIIIDSTNTYGQHSVFKELRNVGIPVKVENYAGKMHAKTMIIDDEYLVIGSANFSNSGENKNDENMLIINNKILTQFYKKYFEYFWEKIPDKYLKQTVRAESKSSIGSCFDGVDNDFDGKIDNADEGCKNK